MILQTSHQTVYRYPHPARDSHNEVRLEPLTDATQRCLEFRLTVQPPARPVPFPEPGGIVHGFDVRESHSSLTILAEATTETHVRDPFDGVNLIADDWSAYGDPSFTQRYAEYLVPGPFTPISREVAEIASALRADGGPSVGSYLLRLNTTMHETLAYDSGVTDVHTTLDEVLALKAGVCQDFAHLMLACCRSQGIPARYVSGYLYFESTESIRGQQATHAWIECPLPDGRWFALDPTNNLVADDRYVRVHVGRDYSEVTPTRGVYIGVPSLPLEVEVHVSRLDVAVPA